MTAKEFLKLSRRDFENGAVRDEIYAELKEKEWLEMIFKKIDINPKLLFGKAPKYET